MTNQVLESSNATDIFTSSFLVGNIGAPFIIGAAVGYFAKKMLKTMVFFCGGIVVVLFISEHFGLISINSELLQEAASSATQAVKNSNSFLVDKLSIISSQGVSSVSGFYLGFKYG